MNSKNVNHNKKKKEKTKSRIYKCQTTTLLKATNKNRKIKQKGK